MTVPPKVPVPMESTAARKVPMSSPTPVDILMERYTDVRLLSRRIPPFMERLADVVPDPSRITAVDRCDFGATGVAYGDDGVGAAARNDNPTFDRWIPRRDLLGVTFDKPKSTLIAYAVGGHGFRVGGTTKKVADAIASLVIRSLPAEGPDGWWSKVDPGMWPHLTGVYLGGLAGRADAIDRCHLWTSVGGIAVVAPTLSWRHTIRWPDVRGVHVEGRSDVQARVTVTRLLIGGLLAFGAPKQTRHDETFVTVELPDDQAVVMRLAGVEPTRVRTLFHPITSALKLTVSAAPVATPEPYSLAGELEKLAELHRSGTLDDAEFAAAKQHLLGTPVPLRASKGWAGLDAL